MNSESIPKIVIGLVDFFDIYESNIAESVEEDGDTFHIGTEEFDKWYENKGPISIKKGHLIITEGKVTKTDIMERDSIKTLVDNDTNRNHHLHIKFDFSNENYPEFYRYDQEGKLISETRVNMNINIDPSEFDLHPRFTGGIWGNDDVGDILSYIIKNGYMPMLVSEKHKSVDDFLHNLSITDEKIEEYVNELNEIKEKVSAIRRGEETGSEKIYMSKVKGIENKVDETRRKYGTDMAGAKEVETMILDQSIRIVYYIMYHMSKYEPKHAIKNGKRSSRVTKAEESVLTNYAKNSGIVDLDTPNVYLVSNPTGRKNKRHIKGWHTRGHWRTYKSGKKVWVRGHVKGDPNQIQGRTYEGKNVDAKSEVEKMQVSTESRTKQQKVTGYKPKTNKNSVKTRIEDNNDFKSILGVLAEVAKSIMRHLFK